jgi:hypothetical protein
VSQLSVPHLSARRYQPSRSQKPMPDALFSNDAKLAKAYPTEADVWKVANKSGLMVDVATEESRNRCWIMNKDQARRS